MRVLVVEDDPKIGEFITAGLRKEGHIVETARDGEAGLELARTSKPIPLDAIVLDLMLPKLSGSKLLCELRAQNILTPVLVLSALDSVDDRVRGLRGGADDYLVKPFAFDELMARLLSLVRRSATTTGVGTEPTLLSVADLTMDRLSRQVWRGSTHIELQPKEFALLEYLLRNTGRAVTKAMILENVWRWTFDPQTNVVDVLFFRLRNKIDRGGGPKLIHTLRGVGYVLRAD